MSVIRINAASVMEMKITPSCYQTAICQHALLITYKEKNNTVAVIPVRMDQFDVVRLVEASKVKGFRRHSYYHCFPKTAQQVDRLERDRCIGSPMTGIGRDGKTYEFYYPASFKVTKKLKAPKQPAPLKKIPGITAKEGSPDFIPQYARWLDTYQ